jgi:putative transposase
MLLVDERGAPLSIVVTGANRHDVTQLEPVLDALCVRRPAVRAGVLQHLCADAGFFGQPAEKAIRARHYTPHVRSRGEEKRRRIKGHKPRRWIVEVAHSWFNRFRKLLVRYEKLHRSYCALNMLAAAIICFRKVNTQVNIIYG